MNRSLRILVFFTIIGLLFSCHSKSKPIKIERAFYYWKTNNYSLGEEERKLMSNLHTAKLYAKFFEVAPDKVFGTIPVSKTDLHIWNENSVIEKDTQLVKTMNLLEVIPTVYIQNNALYNATPDSLDSLADNISFLINKYYTEKVKVQQAPYKEIQIDCDWTKSTRDNYFYLLKAIKKISGKQLSCTLRLYPYKYRDVMGIPPVDKVTLMCYNLVSPLAFDDKNSILDNNELKAYVRNTKKYPVHLDIALPAFAWMQVYKNKVFSGIINPKRNELDSVIRSVKPLWYEVTKDIEVNNVYLRVGDQLKLEEVDEKIMNEAVAALRRHLELDGTTTVTLFHLDAKNLSLYTNEILDKFYTDFTN